MQPGMGKCISCTRLCMKVHLRQSLAKQKSGFSRDKHQATQNLENGEVLS